MRREGGAGRIFTANVGAGRRFTANFGAGQRFTANFDAGQRFRANVGVAGVLSVFDAGRGQVEYSSWCTHPCRMIGDLQSQFPVYDFFS